MLVLRFARRLLILEYWRDSRMGEQLDRAVKNFESFLWSAMRLSDLGLRAMFLDWRTPVYWD